MSIEKNFVIMFFIIWCILVFEPIIRQVQETFTFLLPVYSLSLEEKHNLIDGKFYNFVKLCVASIQENESIIFKVIPQEPDFRTPDWLLKEYLIGRLSYFLYPRKILREQDLSGKAQYIMLFDTNAKTLKLSNR
ncbi:MAG: hypothetical protein WC576_00120 [Candidatus Omnitrophota bacterium]|jgi:hypothetical protein